MPDFTKMAAESWDKVPENLDRTVRTLQIQHATRMVFTRCMLRAYWNRPIVPRTYGDSDNIEFERMNSAIEEVMSQLGWNVTRQIVDSAAARICRPLACKVVTVGGDSKLQQQSLKLTRLVDGLNDDMDTLGIAQRVFIDACTCEVGAILPYWDDGAKEIRQRRIDPMGIFWHYEEGENPSHLYTVEAVSREQMCDLYTRQADKIKSAPNWHRPIILGVEPSSAQTTLDTVKVTCGWKRAQGSTKGRYTMCVGNIPLEHEVYDHPYHQLVLYRWAPDFRGAGGVALSRVLSPYHRWQNQLVQMCYASLRGAVPHVLRHESTMITNLSNMPYQDLTWSGTERPILETPNPVSEQVLQQMQMVPQQAGVESGVNAAVGAGQKPVGINGEGALREYIDFADSRLALPFDAWKKLWSDLAKVYIGLCAENYKNEVIVVKAPGSEFLEEIKWKDVDMEKNKHRVRFHVTSGLSNTVSGKMQQMDNLKSLGLGDAIDYARVLKEDLPDIAAFADRVTAPRDLAIRMVEKALDGEYTPPSPLMGPDGLNAIMLLGTQQYSKALLDGNRTLEQMECLRKLIRAAQRKTAPPVPTPQPVNPLPAIPAGAVQQVGTAGIPVKPQG